MDGFNIRDGVLLKYTGKDTDVTVPDGVIIIGDNAFVMCENIKKVTLPDGVISIGFGAFCDCLKLESINIPDSVQNIGEFAFRLSESLKEINIPKHLNIPSNTFNYKSKWVKKQGDWVIVNGKLLAYNGKNTDEIRIPDTVKTVGRFFCRETMLRKVIIPDSVTLIESNAFMENYTVEEIVLSKSGFTVGKSCFSDTKWFYNLKETLIIGDVLVRYVGDDELYVIPDGIRLIDNRAFSGACELKKVILPRTVEEIESYAFDGCTKLEEIFIPESVRKIQDFAFKGCTSLKKIIMESSTGLESTFIEQGTYQTIYAPDNSPAMRFSRDLGVNFVSTTDSESNCELKMNIFDQNKEFVFKKAYDLLGIASGEIPLDDEKTFDALSDRVKLKNFDDLVRIIGIELGRGGYYENIYKIMKKNGLSLSETVIFREDIYKMFLDHGYSEKRTYAFACCSGKELATETQLEEMRSSGIPKWFSDSFMTEEHQFDGNTILCPQSYLNCIDLALAKYVLKYYKIHNAKEGVNNE